MKAAITGLRIRASISLLAKMLILLKSAAISFSFFKRRFTTEGTENTEKILKKKFA
jgi:hypothetical protein